MMKRFFSTGMLLLLLTLSACVQGSISPTPQPTSTPLNNSSAQAAPAFFQPGSAIRFEALSVDEGLSQSVVNAIAQDQQGFLWFGTQDGLNRYDGDNFVIYKPKPGDPNSLSDSWVTSLSVDAEGFLWVGTRQAGLNRYDPQTGNFTRYLHNPADPASLTDGEVTAIYQTRDGVLWVGTGKGLNRFDSTTGTFTRYLNDPQNPSSLSDNLITDIFQDSRGDLWVGTKSGLNLFDPSSGSARIFRNDPKNPRSLSYDAIASIVEDADGFLWVGTDKGLNRFNHEDGTFLRYLKDPENPGSLGYDNICDLLIDRNGVLWIGTDDGLDRFDAENQAFIHYRYNPLVHGSLGGNIVYSIFEDRGGIVWVGTWGGGVNKFDRAQLKFPYYRYEPGRKANNLPDGQVWAFSPEPDGRVWVGYFGSGLILFDPASGQVQAAYQHDEANPDSLSSSFIYSIFRDSHGFMWVGTANGLNRFMEQTKIFIHYQYKKDDPDSLSENHVMEVYEDRAGNLWVGTARGLDRYDRNSGKFIHYSNDEDPARPTPTNVVDILEDRDGKSLWVATMSAGLYRLDLASGVFERFGHEQGNVNTLANNIVLSIYQDEQGLLWITTAGGGISLYNPATGNFTTYTESEGLSNNFVYCAIPDDDGFLWFSTNYGLSKFNPRTETFENYTIRDGLQSNEFNQSACARGPDNALYFGGGAGFNRFIAGKLPVNQYQPPVVLTDLTIEGKPVKTAGTIATIREITLEWPQNSFEFEFSALSFAQWRKNQYAYKLENFDPDWNYINNKRDGRYTRLPGGEYILRLTAANNDGVWNDTGIAIKVKVIPPFWQTWWFYSLAGLSVIGAVLGGIRLRVHNIEAHRRELEREVQERTREIERLFEQTKELAVIEERNRLARELHDSAKQKAFAALAQLGTANGLIQHDIRAAKLHINEAENLVYDVIQELTFLIQEMYPLALQEKGLVTSLREYAFEWENRTDIPISVQAESEQRLSLELEQAIYRIAQESLANVARHSHATCVDVEVVYSHDAVQMEVHDNGRGFDVSKRPLGIGLRSMQERAESVGGRVTIRSTPGSGTRISVIIPLNGSSKS